MVFKAICIITDSVEMYTDLKKTFRSGNIPVLSVTVGNKVHLMCLLVFCSPDVKQELLKRKKTRLQKNTESLFLYI